MAAPRKRSQSSRPTPSRPTPLWRADKPYNEIPLLPPTIDLETKAILKQCIPARAGIHCLRIALVSKSIVGGSSGISLYGLSARHNGVGREGVGREDCERFRGAAMAQSLC